MLIPEIFEGNCNVSIAILFLTKIEHKLGGTKYDSFSAVTSDTHSYKKNCRCLNYPFFPPPKSIASSGKEPSDPILFFQITPDFYVCPCGKLWVGSYYIHFIFCGITAYFI